MFHTVHSQYWIQLNTNTGRVQASLWNLNRDPIYDPQGALWSAFWNYFVKVDCYKQHKSLCQLGLFEHVGL